MSIAELHDVVSDYFWQAECVVDDVLHANAGDWPALKSHHAQLRAIGLSVRDQVGKQVSESPVGSLTYHCALVEGISTTLLIPLGLRASHGTTGDCEARLSGLQAELAGWLERIEPLWESAKNEARPYQFAAMAGCEDKVTADTLPANGGLRDVIKTFVLSQESVRLNTELELFLEDNPKATAEQMKSALRVGFPKLRDLPAYKSRQAEGTSSRSSVLIAR